MCIRFVFQAKRSVRKSDDTHSQTSHDTTTSDSGRGGSEEDIHSSRGQAISDSGTFPPFAISLCVHHIAKREHEIDKM